LGCDLRKGGDLMVGEKRFGDYAVEMGYCTYADVEEALRIQHDLVTRGFPRMLIGLVMVRYGIIDNNQLIQVLKVLEREQVASLPVN
jgi:hypothetical protein